MFKVTIVWKYIAHFKDKVVWFSLGIGRLGKVSYSDGLKLIWQKAHRSGHWNTENHTQSFWTVFYFLSQWKLQVHIVTLLTNTFLFLFCLRGAKCYSLSLMNFLRAPRAAWITRRGGEWVFLVLKWLHFPDSQVPLLSPCLKSAVFCHLPSVVLLRMLSTPRASSQHLWLCNHELVSNLVCLDSVSQVVTYLKPGVSFAYSKP